jgi:hypothetical protein
MHAIVTSDIIDNMHAIVTSDIIDNMASYRKSGEKNVIDIFATSGLVTSFADCLEFPKIVYRATTIVSLCHC